MPARLSFKIEGEIKSFPDKKKLKDLLLDEEIIQLLSYIVNGGQVQKALQEYGNKIPPALGKDS